LLLCGRWGSWHHPDIASVSNEIPKAARTYRMGGGLKEAGFHRNVIRLPQERRPWCMCSIEGGTSWRQTPKCREAQRFCAFAFFLDLTGELHHTVGNLFSVGTLHAAALSQALGGVSISETDSYGICELL
jgi:hypothetical protein